MPCMNVLDLGEVTMITAPSNGCTVLLTHYACGVWRTFATTYLLYYEYRPQRYLLLHKKHVSLQ
jgi:hypothetical protein